MKTGENGATMNRHYATAMRAGPAVRVVCRDAHKRRPAPRSAADLRVMGNPMLAARCSPPAASLASRFPGLPIWLDSSARSVERTAGTLSWQWIITAAD
jgi:hypothetical protein